MEILVGNTYVKEFSSIFRLVKDCPAFSGRDFKAEGDIELIDRGERLTVRDGNNSYTYVSYIPNAQFVDDDDDDTTEEIGFSENGASWFRGLRGESSAESADAQWMRFIEKVASQYHKRYSIMEYKQQKGAQISTDEAYAIAKNLVKFLFDISMPRKDFEEVTNAKVLEAEALDVYALSLRLALSGGTGESKRILGKIYFAAKTRENGDRVLLPMYTKDAKNIDKAFSGFTGEESGEDIDLTSSDSNARFLTIRDNALNALENLIVSTRHNFVDFLLIAKDDEEVIQQMLKLTAHTTSDLQCSELKVLGISHIVWRVKAFDCKIGGAPKLRAIFGLNNSVSLRCLGCANPVDIVANNSLALYQDPKNNFTQITFRDFEDEETLGLTDEELEAVDEFGVHNDHLIKVQCHRIGLGESCVCYRCGDQMFSAVSPITGKERDYCIDCHRPEVVSHIPGTDEPMLTASARFSISARAMVPEATTSSCQLCGRHFSITDKKTPLCGLCRRATELLGDHELTKEELKPAIDCYNRYAQVVPLSSRMNGAKKYAFEDDGIILLIIGKKIYKFDKLAAESTGQMPSAQKLDFEP